MHDAAREEFDSQAATVLANACGWALRTLIAAAIIFGVVFPIAASQYQKKHPVVIVKLKPGETFK